MAFRSTRLGAIPGNVRGSRRLGRLLVAVVALPALTLVGLGLQLLAQDRALLAQQSLERRQTALQAVARSLDQALTAVERLSLSEVPPAGTARLVLTPSGLRVEPRDAVLWVPMPQPLMAVARAEFTEIEREEFRGDLARADAECRRLTRSTDRSIRAGALLRVARIARKRNRPDEAITAYRELSAMRDVAIEGMPADLVARRALLDVLGDASRVDDRMAAARAIDTDLRTGLWELDRSSWEVTATDVARALGQPVRLPPDKRRLSLVADRVWDEREDPARLARAARTLLDVEGHGMALVASAQGREDRWVAIPAAVLTDWAGQGAAATSIIAGPVSLLSDSGAVFAGPEVARGAVRLGPLDTGLPWTMAVNPESTAPDAAPVAGRRVVLSVGLAAILLLFSGGSYFLWRVVQRELDIARQQTDFVAAVSHEFRTPLTSLRHVTELLSENDELPRERRQAFYDTLGRNTERLQRLVESLLDFASMESGRKLYQRELIDAGALLTRIVTDFTADVSPRGGSVRLHLDAAPSATVLADAASLTTGIWNLLDNAAKYSVDGGDIDVSLSRRDDMVTIAVRDRGIGIPADEQPQIFERFVRGRQASTRGIKGTGLGLAMVSHVVRAHNGTIELNSSEGEGSTFTIVLPHEVAAGSLEGPA